MFKHRCRYKIIGTGHQIDRSYIETDLICPKCGKTGTVYVCNKYEDKLLRQASKGKTFKIPRLYVLTVREYNNMFGGK